LNKEKVKKLKGYYAALQSQMKILEVNEHYCIEGLLVYQIEKIFRGIHSDFEELEIEFNSDEFLSHTRDNVSYYHREGVLSFLGYIAAKIKPEIEETEKSPVIQTRDYLFIKNKDVRDILKRDYHEIQKSAISECWKSVIILCGSSIEAILLDLLIQNESEAKKASAAPSKSNLNKWHLHDMIEVALELELVPTGIGKLSHSIREYRNIIHPGNEIRQELTIAPEEANIAIEVMNILYRELA
jgi:hypothetical protein